MCLGTVDPTHSDDCDRCGRTIKPFPDELTFYDDEYDSLCQSCAEKLNEGK